MISLQFLLFYKFSTKAFNKMCIPKEIHVIPEEKYVHCANYKENKSEMNGIISCEKAPRHPAGL